MWIYIYRLPTFKALRDREQVETNGRKQAS